MGAPLGQAGYGVGLARRPLRLSQALARLGDPRLQILQLTLGTLGRLDQVGGLASMGLRLLRPELTLGEPGLLGGPTPRFHVLRPQLALGAPDGLAVIAGSTAAVPGMHEPERRRRPGPTEDLESRRPLLRHQPSVSEVVGQVGVDGGAEQGIGHAALG